MASAMGGLSWLVEDKELPLSKRKTRRTLRLWPARRAVTWGILLRRPVQPTTSREREGAGRRNCNVPARRPQTRGPNSPLSTPTEQLAS